MNHEEDGNCALANRHVSRLIAIITLYSANVRDAENLDETAKEILISYLNKDIFDLDNEIKRELNLYPPDLLFLNQLLTTYQAKSKDIDELLKANLIEKYSLEKLDRVIKSVLSLAALELLYYQETPAKIIIDEYVSLTKAFYSNSEAAFVNKVTDILAHQTRKEDEF